MKIVFVFEFVEKVFQLTDVSTTMTMCEFRSKKEIGVKRQAERQRDRKTEKRQRKKDTHVDELAERQKDRQERDIKRRMKK